MEVPQIVPKNKTVYIGGRKFVEGDIIPPAFMPRVKVTINKKTIEQPKTRSKYRSRRGAVTY